MAVALSPLEDMESLAGVVDLLAFKLLSPDGPGGVAVAAVETPVVKSRDDRVRMGGGEEAEDEERDLEITCRSESMGRAAATRRRGGTCNSGVSDGVFSWSSLRCGDVSLLHCPTASSSSPGRFRAPIFFYYICTYLGR